ncbi:MAG TPA: ECF-type sigma factor [Pirellulaceae bacterium]|nr:ECF-type sigma factor [Pirellulaceae bacterium]HMO92798.1 ECF-type sigma factor [Pirellulaceae bacterium]HMP69380.1 ECF-type sigma factor [Pirellulaceae bacterium]
MDDKKLGSVSVWIVKARQGDEQAISQLWDRYFEALQNYARRHLPPHLRSLADEEDVAISAFHAMLEGLKFGNLGSVRNRDDLWQVLMVIAMRRARNQVEYENRQKRAAGRKLGGLALGSAAFDRRRDGIPEQNDPAWLTEFAESCRILFDALPSDELRQIAAMKLAGHSTSEIAEAISLVPRTIERKLKIIRMCWLKSSTQEFET